ncbi:hypothetical protein AAG570_007324 [Ranatra chinensis]|uniref:Uncharacterized protein n=1 Tax=Ranatra chinensis TaxID=642074 RepID=A0ABD0Y8K3_9HEMI
MSENKKSPNSFVNSSPIANYLRGLVPWAKPFPFRDASPSLLVEEDDWQRIKQTASRGTVKRLKLLSKRYAKTNYDEDRPRHGRGSSGFAAEQMTIESEDSFSKNSPPVPDSPTTPVKPFQVSEIPVQTMENDPFTRK